MLGSSLAIHSREIGDKATLQQGQVVSLEGEMTRTQKLASELEGQLVEA